MKLKIRPWMAYLLFVLVVFVIHAIYFSNSEYPIQSTISNTVQFAIIGAILLGCWYLTNFIWYRKSKKSD